MHQYAGKLSHLNEQKEAGRGRQEKEGWWVMVPTMIRTVSLLSKLLCSAQWSSSRQQRECGSFGVAHPV